jgi:hypothetical protein
MLGLVLAAAEAAAFSGHISSSQVSDSGAADSKDQADETATPAVPPYEPVRVVPTRPEGWTDWLGRRPISSADRDRILKDLRAEQDELNAVESWPATPLRAGEPCTGPYVGHRDR